MTFSVLSSHASLERPLVSQNYQPHKDTNAFQLNGNGDHSSSRGGFSPTINALNGILGLGFGFGISNGYTGDSNEGETNDLLDVDHEVIDDFDILSESHIRRASNFNISYSCALMESLYQNFQSSERVELNRFRVMDFLKRELYHTIEPFVRLERASLHEAAVENWKYAPSFLHFNIADEYFYNEALSSIPSYIQLDGLDWNERNAQLWRFVFHHVLNGKTWRMNQLRNRDALQKPTSYTDAVEPNFLGGNDFVSTQKALSESTKTSQDEDAMQINESKDKVIEHAIEGDEASAPTFPNIQFIQILTSEIESVSTFNGFIVEGKKFVNQESISELPSITDYFFSEKRIMNESPSKNTVSSMNKEQESPIESKSMQDSPLECKEKPLRIILFSSPLKLSQVKSKHSFEIKSAHDYQKWISIEDAYIERVISTLKKLNLDVLICQWDVSSDIIIRLEKELQCRVIQYMTGNHLQTISDISNAKICFQLEDADESMVGYLKQIQPIRSKPNEEHGIGLVFEAWIPAEMNVDSNLSSVIQSPIQSIVIHTSHPFSGQQVMHLLQRMMHILYTIMYQDDGIAIHGGGALEAMLHVQLLKLTEQRNRCILTQKLAISFLAPIREMISKSGVEYPDDYVNKLIDHYTNRYEQHASNRINMHSLNQQKLQDIREMMLGINPSGKISHTIPKDSNSINQYLLIDSPSIKWNDICHSIDTVCAILKVDKVIEVDDAIDI